MTGLKAKVLIDLYGNLPAQAERFRKNIEGMAESGSRKLALMGRATATLSNQVDRLGNRAVLGIGGLGFLFNRTFVKTAAEFERFSTILETVEGSSDKARQSMAWVTEFATKTPYELAQVTDAFVRLRSYGMDPIKNDLLRTLGDTASAMGKPLESAVEAIADAVTGENERLKEFGIKARIVGKQIVYEYSANGKTMRKSAKANNREQIAATLQTIWNDKYAGSMDKMSKNWDGMTSNLSDQWTQFENRVMQAGAFDYMKGEINGLLGEINRLQNAGDMDSKAKAFSDQLVTGLKAAKEAGKGLWEVMTAVGNAVDFVAQKIGGYEQLAKILASIYIANKAARVTGAGKLGGVILDKVAGRGRGGSGNPLLDAAGRMVPVPVFVVNGPGGLGDLVGGGFKRTKGVVKPSTWKLLRKAPVGAISALGAGAVGTAGAAVAAAGAVGYGVGTLISKAIEGTRVSDAIGAALVRTMAAVGSKTAQESVDSMKRYDALMAKESSQKAKLEIEVKGVPARSVSVREVMSSSALDVDVMAGVMGVR